MDNIYYDGNLKASITVGNITGGTVNAYTKAEVNELLEGKADNKHVHSYNDLTDKPNIPSIEGLASEEYVNNQINNIPKVDLSDYVTNEQLMEDLNSKAEKEHTHEEYLTKHQDISGKADITYVDDKIDVMRIWSNGVNTTIQNINTELDNCATKEELNEVKQSVSNGKELLASAITDKGVNTSKDDTFQTMANNIRQITTGTGGGETPIENPYYVEYRVIPSDYALNDGYNTSYKYGLPQVYSSSNNYTFEYDKVEIELNDGTITDDLSTKTKDIYKVRLWYPENTVALKFKGYNVGNYNLVSIIDYIKTDNFTDMSRMFEYSNISYIDMKKSSFNTSKVTDMNNMFYYCNKLTSLNMSGRDTQNVTNMGSMFYYCQNLTSLDLSNWNTEKVTNMSYMFYYCNKLTSLNLSNFNTGRVTNYSSMLYNVPKTIEWNYDGSNYEKWTLTESQTGYSGTFPWQLTMVTLTISCVDTATGTELHTETKEYAKWSVVNYETLGKSIAIDGYIFDTDSLTLDGNEILMDMDKTITMIFKENTSEYGVLTRNPDSREFVCSVCGVPDRSVSKFRDPDSPTGYKCPICQTILEYRP